MRRLLPSARCLRPIAAGSHGRHFGTRALGGLPLARGVQTRAGIVIRADSPTRLTTLGLERALSHPVRTVIDLREAALAVAEPNPLRDRAAVVYHHLPLLPEDFPLPVVRGGYPQAADAAQSRIAAVCRALLAGETPALVHCHSGTGRTGLVAIVLLDLAGVTSEAIVDDFRASLDPDAGPSLWTAASDVLEHLERRHGGVRGYLEGAGLKPDEIDRLGRLLL